MAPIPKGIGAIGRFGWPSSGPGTSTVRRPHTLFPSPIYFLRKRAQMSTRTTTGTRTKARAAASGRNQPVVSWVVAANRMVVLGVLGFTTLFFLTNANDVYVTPKVTALLVGALALVGTTAWASTTAGSLRVPMSPAVGFLGAVVAIMALSTAINGHRLTSLFGEYGRGAGLLTFVAGLVLFVLVLTDVGEEGLPFLVSGATVIGGVVMLYGLLQALGFEPFSGAPSQDSVVTTLGQVNLTAGFSGVVLPLFLWAATDRRRPYAQRVPAGAAVLATAVVASQSLSFQALLSMGAGGVVFAVAFGLDRWPARRVAAAAVVVLLVGAMVAGVAHGQVEEQVRSGLDERVLMWQAAGDMIGNRPIFGNGPSGYAAEFARYRPRAHAERFGVFQLVDVPHSVPIAMLVTGGMALGLAYLAFVGYVGWALVRGLRRSTGDRRLLLGAVGGAWFAYQAQSLVSFDGPTFVAFELVSAASVLLLAAPPRIRTVTLPSLVRRQGRRSSLSGAGRSVLGLVLVVVLAGVWWTVRPLVADVADARGRELRASGTPDASLASFERATSLAPWVGRYWTDRAAALVEVGDQDNALLAGQRAALASPSSASFALSTAQLALRMGREDVADKWSAYAAENSPTAHIVLDARAQILVALRRPKEAIPLFRRAARFEPNEFTYVLHLAQAYQETGRISDARRAYRKVLAMRPDDPTALAGVAALGQGG
jgi:Flp pilus assembly protein TadD/O-antigen ligase